MRLLGLFLVLAFLGTTPNLLAQNYFGDVPNEPRPAEFLHWDADAFADFQNELEEDIATGRRTWGTEFVTSPALAEAPHRRHDIVMIYRSGYTQPEIHEEKWDIYVVVEGSGTVLVGGERVGWVDGLPPDQQRPQLSGATEFQVTEGDIVHVPARSWHQVVLDEGESMTYALINVMYWEEDGAQD